MADSILALQDTYDQRIYAIGKGPSQTLINASPKTSIEGSSVLLEGSVVDISPGTKDYAIAARFPEGVPAINDASMSEWMKYVYMQFSEPTNVSGVEVKLNTLDPNGNYVYIGTAISDASGKFGFVWNPEVPGKYTVYATFEGSNSYYASTTETFIAVDPVAATPTSEPIKTASIADTYFIPAIAGLFVFVAIIGAIIILMLRKRP